MTWPRTRDIPLILGHRGASAHVTENTMLAFQRARDGGADGVELDVRLCGTGEVVVFHDDTLERLAGRPERIDSLGWAELAGIELPGGTSIPSLEEVLASVSGYINVEIKPPRARDVPSWATRVAEVILASGRTGDILVTSFHPGVLAFLRLRYRKLQLGFLFHAQQSSAMRATWRALPGLVAVHAQHVLIDPRSVTTWTRRGLAVGAWTVDRPDRARRLAALGVTAIITNDPQAIALALHSDRKTP